MSEWQEFHLLKVAKGLFSPAECHELITSISSISPAKGRTQDQQGKRDCSVWWLQWGDFVGWPFSERLVAASSAYPEFDITDWEAPQVARYEPGQYYDWHIDFGAAALSRRKLTCVVELKSAKMGGGLEIFPLGPISLNQGDVAIFPSFAVHRARPVEAGERWSMTMWHRGEPLR